MRERGKFKGIHQRIGLEKDRMYNQVSHRSSDSIGNMANKIAVPAYETISKTGDGLEITGIFVSVLCLLIGCLTLFSAGTATPFLGVGFGLLLMITGYTKKTSAATMAMFILQTQGLGQETENNAGEK